MTVGVLLVTHGSIGKDLLATTVATLGICPLGTAALSVRAEDDPDLLGQRAAALVAKIDQGDGVLVLTDIYGSTPSNIAYRLLRPMGIRVVSGVNLPMMLRVMNYPQLNLDALAEKAISGGRDGIMDCCPNDKRAP